MCIFYILLLTGTYRNSASPASILLTSTRDVTGSEHISGIARVCHVRQVIVCRLVGGFGRVQHFIRNTSDDLNTYTGLV